jgi:hypothetical protein
VNGGLSDGQGVEVREYIAPVSQRPTSDASSMNTGYYKKYGKKPVIDPSKKVRGHERETSDMQERAEAHKKRFETATEDLLTAIRSYKLSRSGESSQAPSIGSAFIGFKDTLDLIRERKSFSLRPKHAALLKSENAVEIGRYMQQVQNILNQLEEDEDLNPKTADISVSVCKDATQNDVPHLITYFEELQKQLRLRKQDLTPKVDEEALQAQQAAELVLHEQNLAEIAKQKFEEQKAKDLADIAFTKHGLPDHDIVDIFNSLTITCRFGVNNLFDQVNKEFAASENHITFKDQDDFKAQYTHAYTTLQSVVSWDELTKEENRRLIRSVRGMVKALKKVVKFK